MFHPLGSNQDKFTVTSGFRPKERPDHTGLDLAPYSSGPNYRSLKNAPVYALEDGIASQSYYSSGGYGECVRLVCGSAQGLYAHLKERLVKPNQQVKRGQIIGYVGSTGRSTKEHLHFELVINGQLVDPLPYLKGEKVTIEAEMRIKCDGLVNALLNREPTEADVKPMLETILRLIGGGTPKWEALREAMNEFITRNREEFNDKNRGILG